MKLTSKEIQKAYTFTLKHVHCNGDNNDNIFKIKTDKSSGIGVGVSIKCNHCKDKKDITDYGAW